MALRVSLGAARWRIVRQLLVESALLAVAAGVVGFLLSIWGVHLIRATFVTVQTPFWIHFTIDARVYIFLVVVMLGTVVLFGLAPALHISKTDVNDVLKEGGHSGVGSVHAR